MDNNKPAYLINRGRSYIIGVVDFGFYLLPHLSFYLFRLMENLNMSQMLTQRVYLVITASLAAVYCVQVWLLPRTEWLPATQQTTLRHATSTISDCKEMFGDLPPLPKRLTGYTWPDHLKEVVGFLADWHGQTIANSYSLLTVLRTIT